MQNLAKSRTQADIDNYNKQVNDLNTAMNDFNRLNTDMNKKREFFLDKMEQSHNQVSGLSHAEILIINKHY